MRGGGAEVAALLIAALIHVPACAATRGGAAPARDAGAAAARAAAAPAADTSRAFPRIAILCYHDVSDDPSAPLQTVPPEFLREQIRAARAQGWSFLSLADLLAHRGRPDRLPPRVMVLTFDDGYRSFAERALPILEDEGVPATLAVITSFVDRPAPELPPLLGWEELRALAARGVEIVSHAHALHRYETSNPQRDTAPSVGTRRYLAAERRYEDREQYRSRIHDDLMETQRVLRERLGRPAVVLAWPFGVHNEMARGLAARAGFEATLSLAGRAVSPEDLRLGCLPRVMMTRRLDLTAPDRWLDARAPVRAAQVDLDALWDPDESVFRARLDQAVARATALGATHVILPACPDPRDDGRVLRSWAMNHQLPVLADVWSMAAAKFVAARFRVWLRAPSMNLTWAWERHPEWRIAGDGRRGRAMPWGTRLSPDVPGVRQAAADFFTDLAVYLPIDGVVFDDDAVLLEREQLALDGPRDPATRAAAIRGLIEHCKRAVRAWRPDCRFARVVPEGAVERAGVDPRSAVDFDECLARDELVVVAAAAGTRGGPPSAAAVERAAKRTTARWRATGAAGPPRTGAPPVLLMLPAYDRARHGWVPAAAQQAMADAALRAGMVHLGTAPIAARGELPIGLLDDGLEPADARTAEQPY